jgi:hypothetical protein
MSFSFLGVPPPNSPDECGTLTKQIIRTCLLRTNVLQGGGGNTINVTNLINIVNNFLNRCANYPLRIDASANQCIEISPGFCGSILQNINDAWGIYRSPGITEITVGAGGDGVAPGANFPDVASAFGAPNTPTDCNFIRITSDVTDGPLVLPANTLIYIDPGVNWTVTGPITISGDFVLWGANPTPSSTLTYNNIGSVPLIGGAGSLLIQNLHIIHTAGNNEPVVTPSIPTRMKHVVVDVGATVASFISDTGAPLVNMTLDHVTINGAGANRPLRVGDAASVFRCTELEFTGTFTTAMIAAVATHEWNGIRNRSTAAVGFTIGGTISDFQDITQTATLSLGPDVQITNMTFNTMIISGANNRMQVNNATGLSISLLLFPSNVVFNNVTTNALVGNALDLGANCQINNFRVVTAVPTITSSFIASPQLSNIILPSAWSVRGDIAGVLTNQTMYLSNIYLTGAFSFNTGFPGAEPTTTCQINNLRCTGFTFGSAATDCGIVMVSDMICTGNCSIFVGRGNGAEQNGEVYMSNFRIAGTYTHTQSTSGAYSSGLVAGNALWVGPPGLNSSTRQKWNCAEFQGNMDINSDNNSFTNIMALSTAIAIPRNLTITGNANIIHGLNTWRLSQFSSQAGIVTISGENNVCTSWFMNGGSFVVTGAANTFTGIRISGNVVAAGGTQLFNIFGSQCKLSNIYLGAIVGNNFANFTADGFGSTTDGSYNVNLGNPAGGTSGLQVENFSLYPKRGQTIVAGVGDITGVANPANMLINFNAFASAYNNIRVWFYPGGQAVPGPPFAVLVPSAASLVTVTGTCSQSQFQNMIIGFAQDTPGATAGLSLGTLQVIGAGTDNSFQNVTTVIYLVTQANANFVGVNGFAFAQVGTPPQFTSSGAGTTLSQINFPAIGSNITLSGANACLCNSTIGGGPAGVPVFGLTMPVTADRAIVNGNQFVSGPTSISIAGAIPFPPLFVGNANSGVANVAPFNGAGAGNY